MPVKTQPTMSLGVHRIEPVRLEDPLIQSALEQARRSLSNPRLGDIMRIRTAIQSYLCDYLARDGFVHPPIYMLAGCTDPLNHWTYPARINYYGEETSITQSLILQKILIVMLSTADKVFWASPNVRMEMRVNRKDYKYATEFMQVDFEKKNGTYEEMLEYVSSMVRGLYAYLNEHYADILVKFRGGELPALDQPLSVYDTADFENGSDHDRLERELSGKAKGKPFLLVNMKREAYDCLDRETGRYLNFDIVIPPFGDNSRPVECLSGAERTRSLSDLKERMSELGYPLDYFEPFFDLFGSINGSDHSIACAGAGFGVERLTFAILGLADVHEVYPFPRLAEAKIAL